MKTLKSGSMNLLMLTSNIPMQNHINILHDYAIIHLYVIIFKRRNYMSLNFLKTNMYIPIIFIICSFIFLINATKISFQIILASFIGAGLITFVISIMLYIIKKMLKLF